MMTKTVCLLLVGGGLVGTGTAFADDKDEGTYEKPGMYSYAWSEPRLYSQIGIGITAGGGVGGFTDQTMRNTLNNPANGLWGLRVSLGTHIPIGVDLSYLGTAADIDALTNSQTGTLVGTTVEGALRYNILPHYAWNPYIFAGVGWQRYDVTSANFRQADTGIKDSADVAVFPMGAGFGYRDLSGFTVDLRGTFRASDNSDFVHDANGNQVDLHTWEASGALGYEF